MDTKLNFENRGGKLKRIVAIIVTLILFTIGSAAAETNPFIEWVSITRDTVEIVPAFVVLRNRNGNLNVRAEPVDGRKVCVLYDAEDIHVWLLDDEPQEWYLIALNSAKFEPIGWVKGEYIHLFGAPMKYNLDTFTPIP